MLKHIAQKQNGRFHNKVHTLPLFNILSLWGLRDYQIKTRQSIKSAATDMAQYKDIGKTVLCNEKYLSWYTA
jgi:hypothetical protein